MSHLIYVPPEYLSSSYHWVLFKDPNTRAQVFAFGGGAWTELGVENPHLEVRLITGSLPSYCFKDNYNNIEIHISGKLQLIIISVKPHAKELITNI